LDAMSEAFPGVDIYLMYGLTEAFRSTYLEPSQVNIRPGSIGKAIPDVEILVVDENGEPCPPDVPGELVHLGGVIAKGYWNAPEKSAERFRPWPDASGNNNFAVFSGDVVRRDVEGYLYFIGRRDNMIKTSGHRVSPEEIERMAEAMPGISDAVAFGRQHPVLGEEIVLICTHQGSDKSPDEFALKTFLRERLAAYMVPHVVLFTENFAVTAGNQGKIDRETAKQLAADYVEAS
jgi:acyl-CoA synthetase (AMP-forming)/AMP-acid ligase II